MMHPASKVNMRRDVASGGNMLENPEARRREMQGFQISNVQIRPPRVGSAPIPHNAPMNFQPMLGSRNASHMLGSTQGINDPGNQGFFPNSMFPQRTIPRTQSPIGMPSGGYFTGGDVRQDGGFPPRPMMFHNSQQQEKFDTHDQQGQIDEIESNSVSSDEKPTKVPIHTNGNRGNKLMYNTNIMGISEMINEDEFVAENNSRENYSGAGSGNHDTQRKKPAQPSNRMRGQLNQQSVKPPQQAPGSNLPSYQVYESYQSSAAYGVDNQSKPYSEHVDNPSDGYYKQIYDKVNDQYYEQNYYEYDTYGQSDYGDQPYQNHRDANVPSYDQSCGKQQAKNKGKDKKGKPRNGKDRENIEIYEPSGGRTTPGGHAKNKNYNGEKYPIHNVTQDWNKQQGSRYIQHLLGSQDKDMANSIVREMIPQMVDISLNIFGNYVAQKMIEVGIPL